jgi:hypothetical protein
MSKRYPGNSITGNPVALSQTSNNGIWDLKDNYAAVGNGTWQEVDGIYEIPNSLRFRSATSAYLSRTPSVAGNRRTWTLSAWVKRSVLGSVQQIICAGTPASSPWTFFYFNSDDTLHFYEYNGTTYLLTTTPVFRDTSAWYHIVLSFDSTQAAAPDRTKIYVNGRKQELSGVGYVTQNFDTTWNNTALTNNIGRRGDASQYFDGYMTEMNFIDGQALDPSYFGYTDSITGIWQPKRYTGGYGTNGYYLPFNQYASPRMLGKNYNSSNLLTYSEQLDNAAWSKPAAPVAPTVTANAIAAPDGSNTADLITFAGATTHACYQEYTVPTFVTGDTYTASMYLKTSVAGTYNLQLVYFYTSGGNQDGYANVVFNSSGVLTSCTPSNAYMTASAQYVGNGWYRVSATNQWLNQGGAFSGTTIRMSIGQGSGASSIYAWGAQLNLGNTADPYVQTVASNINNSWAPNGGLVVSTSLVANTANIIHSRYLRYTNGDAATAIQAPNTNVFSGYALTGAGEGKNNVAVQYTAPTGIPYVTLEIKYGNSNNSNANGAVLYVNGTQVDTIPYAGSATPRIYQTTTAGTLTSCGVGGGVSGQYESYISYIKINGVMLGDANYNCISPDSPTNVFTTVTDIGGIVPGNYATLNPLFPPYSSASTYSEGNLRHKVDSNGGATDSAFSSIAVSSGKWYAECLVAQTPSAGTAWIGVCNNVPAIARGLYGGGVRNVGYAYKQSTGYKCTSDNTGVAYGATYTTGDVIGIALDLDSASKTITFYKNGVSQGVAFTGLTSNDGNFIFGNDQDPIGVMYWNFGQYQFTYTPPAGFKSLNTTNLQALGTAYTAIAALTPNRYFDIKLYTGNSANTGNTISGLNFAPDLVWIKHRSATIPHSIYDTRRGAGRRLSSSTVEAETNYESQMTSFNSDGFTVATNNNEVNEAGKPYVAWQWKESPTAGLNIVPYTGTGVARSISHNLGVAPSFMIVKNRTQASVDWPTFHAFTGNTGGNTLNESLVAYVNATWWNNTSPTSSNFTVGTSAQTNGSGHTMIAYLFAEVPGFSKFGNYVGNAAADGPFVYTGFKPRWLLIKQRDTTINGWYLHDTARDTYNPARYQLYANVSNGENNYAELDIVSNGFKIRVSTGEVNNSGNYIYIAFAESPFALNNRAR